MGNDHVHEYKIGFTETANGEICIEAQLTATPRYIFICDCGAAAWKNPYDAEKLGLARVIKVERKMSIAARENRKTTLDEL
jgi:hypothetical protein